MYSSSANIAYGKNCMWSSSNVGMTEALIKQAVSLNNNGDDLFNVVDIEGGQAIAPNQDLPLQASNFKITSTDEQITADDTNACSVGVVRDFINDIDTRLLENYMTETECDSKYLTKNGWNGSYTDPATEGYSKTEVDSALSNKANSSDVYTKAQVDSSLSTKANSSDVYTKAQVDDLISGIEPGITEEELEEKLEDYATKDWVEAAIGSSGASTGIVVYTRSGTPSVLQTYHIESFETTPSFDINVTYIDSPNPYATGYYATWLIETNEIEVYYHDIDDTAQRMPFPWGAQCFHFKLKQIAHVDDGQGGTIDVVHYLGELTPINVEDASTTTFILKGYGTVTTDMDAYDIVIEVSWNPPQLGSDEDIYFHFKTNADNTRYVYLVKQADENGGYVTKTELNETKTEIANTYLSKTQATSTYYTKAQVDEAIANIPDGGMVTIELPIPSQTLTVSIEDTATSGSINLFELAESETMNTIKVNINCTITSNGTDITHNLDDYSFLIKDTSNNTLCTLNSIYETNNTTTLEGSYTNQITSSNKQLVLCITREASTPAESIVLTTTETNIGTVSQTISGYITKIYADEHYASKDTPTVMNITNYDESTHTTNKTTYDFGPDFTIEFGLDIALKVTIKAGSPAVQMASAAICTLLQFGLDKLTSGSLTASNDAYQMDIHNVIGTSQLAALTDFNTWVSSYSRYSGTTLNNFLITAAAAEQRYLTSSSLSNYYTKTEVDNLIGTAEKLQWNATVVYPMKLEPETVSSQGDVVTSLNYKQGNTTLARIVSSPTAIPTVSSIHAHYIKPVDGIEFGKNIDGSSQLTQWSGTISNIANDNYDSTTYSSANLDTIVPSVKFLNTLHYTKTQVDSAIVAGIGALSNTYVTKTNPGTLTGNLTVNGEIYTSSITTTGDINLTQGAILDASGDAQIGGDLTVDGQTNLNGDLMVNANMTVSNNAQFDDTVIIDGTTTINNDCNVNGCFTLDGDLNITNSGALDVTGSSTFHHDVTCNDILTVDSTLYTNDFVATGIVEFQTNNIIIGTSGNTITINKAFFDSITGPTPCGYAFNSWNVRNNKFTANTNFTDDVCSFTMANGSIIGYGGRVGFKIRIVFYLTDSTQKASALNSLKFRLESRVANHYNDIRVYGEPDEVYDENSSNYYDDRICVNFIGVWIDLTTSSSPSPLMGVRYKNTLSSDINLSASPMDITVRVWKL